jgi:hypothetical protein
MVFENISVGSAECTLIGEYLESQDFAGQQPPCGGLGFEKIRRLVFVGQCRTLSGGTKVSDFKDLHQRPRWIGPNPRARIAQYDGKIHEKNAEAVVRAERTAQFLKTLAIYHTCYLNHQ